MEMKSENESQVETVKVKDEEVSEYVYCKEKDETNVEYEKVKWYLIDEERQLMPQL